MKPSFRLLTSLLLPVILALPAARAWANVAANTQIVNQATLTYSGGTAHASVTVTVATINSQANITITGAGPVAWTGPNTPTLIDNIVVTSTSNGPATYLITPSIAGQTNNGNGGSYTINGGVTQSVTLGASVTTASTGHASDTNNLVIPKPDPTHFLAGPIANGIGATTALTWAIGSNNYVGTVSTVADNGDGTVTLHFNNAITAPPAGTPVFEYKTLPVVVSPGSPATGGTDITVTVSANVANGGLNTPIVVPTPGLNTWTTSSGNGALKKYVRNLTTTSANNNGTNPISFTVDSRAAANYFDGGVTGGTGDVLEYVLEASDTSTTVAVTSAIITDVVPIAYVTYLTNQYTSGSAVSKDVWYKADTGAVATLTAALGGSNSDTLTVPVGGPVPVAAAGGTIPANGVCLIAYQVRIK
jgi:hypothetical protein